MEKQFKHHQKDLKICQTLLGDKHPDLAACYNHIGNAYNGFGLHSIAIEYQEMALKIHLSALDESFSSKCSDYLQQYWRCL